MSPTFNPNTFQKQKYILLHPSLRYSSFSAGGYGAFGETSQVPTHLVALLL